MATPSRERATRSRLALHSLLGASHADTVRGRFNDSLVSMRLLRAIKRREVEVFYQPIRAAATGRLVALEALARWTGSECGRVAPDRFIPQAERTGAVTALDRFVLREAARQATQWPGTIAVSVNISAATLSEQDLVAGVTNILAETGLAPHRLQLEITESAIIEDVPATARQVAQLRQLGVRVAIDDFGTGQSSLSYLDHFAVDTIKIDRTLVAPTCARPGSDRLIAGIITMLRGLDLNVVAEGVETADQLALLRSMGCPLVQGYYLGRPSPAVEIEGTLRAASPPASSPVRLERAGK
jgi:EAL domain-containing protein (putative c-di-GMP-specific phosphodiesterase class I)